MSDEKNREPKRSIEEIDAELDKINDNLVDIEKEFETEIREAQINGDEEAIKEVNKIKADFVRLQVSSNEIKNIIYEKNKQNKFDLSPDKITAEINMVDVTDNITNTTEEQLSSDDNIEEINTFIEPTISLKNNDELIIRKKHNKKKIRKSKGFSKKMKIGVTRFPGTNNEYESIRVLESFGVTAEIINSFEAEKISDMDGIWIAGGFSYADVLRAGAIASTSDLLKEIKKSSKPILGVCNGFQILTEANLLPGSLIPNNSTKFICDWIHIKIPENNSYLSELAGLILRLPIAHFEGNLFARNLDEVQPYQIALYSNYKGLIHSSFNPNGSIGNIAGLGKDNIVALMPHPERASYKHQGSTDGRKIIEAFLMEAKM